MKKDVEKALESINRKIAKENKKFELTEEVVKLGTIDTTILTLIVFLITLILSILSFGVPKQTSTNPISSLLIVMYAYVLILIFPLFYSIIFYPLTIFQKNGRFTNKRIILTVLSGTILFIAGVCALAIIFLAFEGYGKPIPNSIIEISVYAWLFIDILFSIFKIGPKIKKYFYSELPNMLTNREKEIAKWKERKLQDKNGDR